MISLVVVEEKKMFTTSTSQRFRSPLKCIRLWDGRIVEVAEKGEASDYPATRIAKRANKVLHKTLL